jgi:hypothetical protein
MQVQGFHPFLTPSVGTSILGILHAVESLNGYSLPKSTVDLPCPRGPCCIAYSLDHAVHGDIEDITG